MQQYHFLDPQTSDNTRCVFDIQMSLNEAIDPDIRITNLGAFYDNTGDLSQRCFYPANLGVKSVIKNIYLRVNDQQVETLMNANLVQSWLNLLTKNGRAFDIESELERSNRSYIKSLTAAGKVLTNKGFDTFPILAIQQDKIMDMTVNGNAGIIKLLDYFSFLQALKDNNVQIYMKYLSLRVEIEFETSVLKYNSYDSENDVLPADANLSMYRPVLITKRTSDKSILDGLENMHKETFTVPYRSWITEYATENIVTNANMTALINPNNYKLQSAQGKTVLYAVAQTIFSTDDTSLAERNVLKAMYQNGNFISFPNYRENLKIQLNGMQFIPFNGIDTPALKRLYRDCVVNSLSTDKNIMLVQGCDSASSRTDTLYALVLNDATIKGQTIAQSYYAIPFNQKINTLDVTYQCTSSTVLPLNNKAQNKYWHYNYFKAATITNSVVTIQDL